MRQRQTGSRLVRLARLVGFVLGAEGRRSTKTEDVATQRSGSPSFVSRPVLPDRVSPARLAWSFGSTRGTRKGRARCRRGEERKRESRGFYVYVCAFCVVCDRAALGGEGTRHGGSRSRDGRRRCETRDDECNSQLIRAIVVCAYYRIGRGPTFTQAGHV